MYDWCIAFSQSYRFYVEWWPHNRRLDLDISGGSRKKTWRWFNLDKGCPCHHLDIKAMIVVFTFYNFFVHCFIWIYLFFCTSYYNSYIFTNLICNEINVESLLYTRRLDMFKNEHLNVKEAKGQKLERLCKNWRLTFASKNNFERENSRSRYERNEWFTWIKIMFK